MTLLKQSMRSAVWVTARMASRHVANAVLFLWLAIVLDPGDLGIATLSVGCPCLPCRWSCAASVRW